MITAVVLAAGDSSRMGRPKALLDWKGDTFLGTVCRRLREAGLAETVVVLGRDAEAIQRGWARANERVVINPRPEGGQISSLKLALRSFDVNPPFEAAMVCLVDAPLVEVGTYRRLAEEWRARQGSLVVPRFHGKRGHPLILDQRFWHETELAPSDHGLHWVTHRNADSMHDVDVDDRGAVTDIDTPEDYEEVLKKWN